MNAQVLMSSGSVDSWVDIKTVEEGPGGQLLVLDEPGEDDLPVVKTKGGELVLLAAYAPGMWMRVTYGSADIE